MKLNAIGVTSSNFQKTIEFYKLLGFRFEKGEEDSDHIESIPANGSAKLMIDSIALMTGLLGKDPKPSNHGAFAIEYDSPDELNSVVEKVTKANFKVIKPAWDAFWGQRYAVLEDPDGYQVDLYSNLK